MDRVFGEVGESWPVEETIPSVFLGGTRVLLQLLGSGPQLHVGTWEVRKAGLQIFGQAGGC